MANQLKVAFTATYWTGVQAKEEEEKTQTYIIYIFILNPFTYLSTF